MKKIILLLVGIVAIGALGWYTKKLISGEGSSDTQLIDFAIKDTNSVDKIIVSDAFSRKIELVRKGKLWQAADGSCISQEGVHLMLDAMAKITLKGYLSDKAQKKFTELMSTSNTKVEIYQNGEWSKTWYIGPTSQDHLGQIMLLESAEYGKSAFPVLMSLSGTYGIIDPRFYADPRKWMCTKIFAHDMEEIRSVEVKFPKESYRNFKVVNGGARFQVTQNGKKLSNLDTANVYRYLQGFKKVHFELANYELSQRQVDSVKRSTAFCELRLKEKRGKSQLLRLFRIKSDGPQQNEMGEIVDIDMNKFWCQLPSGDLVKCQYFVFNPLIMGYVFFPAMEEKFPENAIR